MKLKTQILAITLGLAATTSLVWSADRPRETTPTIQGVWQVTRMGVDCNDPSQHGPPFPALMTFHKDGTLYGDAGDPATGSGEHGVWQRESGSQNYSFRFVANLYDANGEFDGRIEITGLAHLTSANSFEYSSTIQIFDADGNLVITLCGRATGTRFE